MTYSITTGKSGMIIWINNDAIKILENEDINLEDFNGAYCKELSEVIEPVLIKYLDNYWIEEIFKLARTCRMYPEIMINIKKWE